MQWDDQPLIHSKELGVPIKAADWNSFLDLASNPSKLHYIDRTKEVYGCSDASIKGWGFILFQLKNEMLSWDHPDQEKVIVAISSGSFNRAQMNWGTTEQECFAFCRGILDNEFLLAGREFNLITDHKNLSYIAESESKKVRRWKLALQ